MEEQVLLTEEKAGIVTLTLNRPKVMNCLNFVFVPKRIESRERLDQLYNEHVKRFYTDPAWRGKLTRRLWQHRYSLRHLLFNLPAFLAARRRFETHLVQPG